MKLKLSKRWYEVRSKAEETCMDVAAGMSLSRVTKKAGERTAKKPTMAQGSRSRAASSKRREK